MTTSDRFDHVGLNVADLPAMVGWYTEAGGAPSIRETILSSTAWPPGPLQKRPPKSPTIASPSFSSKAGGISGAIQLGALRTTSTTAVETAAKAAVIGQSPKRSMMPP